MCFQDSKSGFETHVSEKKSQFLEVWNRYPKPSWRGYSMRFVLSLRYKPLSWHVIHVDYFSFHCPWWSAQEEEETQTAAGSPGRARTGRAGPGPKPRLPPTCRCGQRFPRQRLRAWRWLAGLAERAAGTPPPWMRPNWTRNRLRPSYRMPPQVATGSHIFGPAVCPSVYFNPPCYTQILCLGSKWAQTV